MEGTNPELKVSGTTIPSKLGGAIVKYLEEAPEVVVAAMGDQAVSKAVKGIIVAQSFLSASAREFKMKLGFRNNKDTRADREVTVIVFCLERNW
jgi:stage V sporulation protein SpoVS